MTASRLQASKQKTVFVHFGIRIIPFSISIVKNGYPEENNMSTEGLWMHPDIVTELETPVPSIVTSLPRWLPTSGVAASEISRLHDQNATLIYANDVVHDAARTKTFIAPQFLARVTIGAYCVICP